MPELILIHPPAALPSEPSVGLSLLAGRLRAAGADLLCIDANIEALCAVVHAATASQARSPGDQRAIRHRDRAWDLLRSPSGYENLDRHHSAISTLRRCLDLASAHHGTGVGLDLAQYEDPDLRSMHTPHLRAAAASPERSPYAPYFEALTARVAALAPRVVGLSVGYLNQALPAMALCGTLRRALPGLRILLGGSLISCFRGRLSPEALAPVVDRLVFGDGTAALSEALGLPIGPDPVADPDFDAMPWSQYMAPGPIVPLSTSLGCFWGRCAYCPEAAQGQRFRLTVDRDLPALMHRLAERTGAVLFHLTDSAVPPRSLSLLRHLKEPMPWYGFSRFQPLLARPEVCRDLRRSGCRMLQLGLESGSEAVLRRLNKGITLPLAEAVLQGLFEAGIAVYLYVMFGIPGETEADAEQTMAFVARNAHRITFINTALLNLPQASPPEEDLCPLPFPVENDLTLYSNFRDQSGMDRRAARIFLERRFSRQPEVAELLRRTPAVLGANHAPLFLIGTRKPSWAP